MPAMLTNPRTSLAGGAGALLLALFAFLGPEPISWQRAAVLVAGCLAIAALGIFSHGSPSAPQPLPGIAALAPAPSRPEADVPPTVGP